jgi:hypothetical protein
MRVRKKLEGRASRSFDLDSGGKGASATELASKRRAVGN